jgi:hypothetical protein
MGNGLFSTNDRAAAARQVAEGAIVTIVHFTEWGIEATVKHRFYDALKRPRCRKMRVLECAATSSPSGIWALSTAKGGE